MMKRIIKKKMYNLGFLILLLFLLTACTPRISYLSIGRNVSKENQTQTQVGTEINYTLGKGKINDFKIDCSIQQDNLCAAQAYTQKGWSLGTVPLELVNKLINSSNATHSQEISLGELSKYKIKGQSYLLKEIVSYVYNSSEKVLSLAKKEYEGEYSMVKVVPVYFNNKWVWKISFFYQDFKKPVKVVLIDFKADKIIKE